MHGNYRFSWPNAPLNHIAGRVKIVLGKKVDKHSVRIPWEGVAYQLCQSHVLSATYSRLCSCVLCSMYVCTFEKSARMGW